MSKLFFQDFTLKTFHYLLKLLLNKGYSFQTFEGYLRRPLGRVVLLRHDVDAKPINSLRTALIEHGLGLKGTYYFRIVPDCLDSRMIDQIAKMGHEVGYHYEDLSLAPSNATIKNQFFSTRELLRYQNRKLIEKELADIGINTFYKNLQNLRNIASVDTICMHGSPLSSWDSRLLWKYYNYHDYKIIGEPYFDLNFHDIIYLTDTGRRWDGSVVSIRDKYGVTVNSSRTDSIFDTWIVKPISGSLFNMTLESKCFQNKFSFRSTYDIIKASEDGFLPDKIMLTVHPQRWTDDPGSWIKELIWQNLKNAGKYFIVKMKD